jgi:NAD(P)-dependent dehydrogenase (short-subunit alcohol dehydrogenase family)
MQNAATDIGNDFSIEGKTALVTGATSGIGRMIAESLLRYGVHVYISSRRPELCEQVCAELSAIGKCDWIAADLAKSDAVGKLVSEFSRRESALHILVNNAGRTLSGPIDTYSMCDWDEVFAVNVRSPFELISRVLPKLDAAATKEDPARIINIGSISGTLVTNSNSAFPYGASKAAIHHLTRELAIELAPRNITVNAIAPGIFVTKMTDFTVGDRHLYDYAAEATPLGRVGSREDIGGLVTYLSGRMGAFVSGAILPLDGAWSVKGL